MNRIYCLDCRKFYAKVKTGFEIPFDNTGNVKIRGDLYRCGGCDREVLGDFGIPFDVRERDRSR